MKSLTLVFITFLLFIVSCKKDNDGYTAASGSPGIIATPPPAGFQFPKTFKESQRILDYRVWLRGTDITSKTNVKDLFEFEEWQSGMSITLVNTNTLELRFTPTGPPFAMKYFYYRNGLYAIDNGDTITFPIALGNYSEIEFYDYKIKLTSGGSSYGKSVFEKATKASLEKEAADMNMHNIDTMAYMNRSLVMK